MRRATVGEAREGSRKASAVRPTVTCRSAPPPPPRCDGSARGYWNLHARRAARQGLATAAASLVLEPSGTPAGSQAVWSTGEANHASLRMVHKLGFEERCRRACVIPERR